MRLVINSYITQVKIFVLALAVLLFSCRGMKDSATDVVYSPAQPEYGEGITFITFMIFKDDKEKVSFSHYQTIHAEGRLKEPKIELMESQIKYILQLLDTNNQPLIEFPMRDVLNPSMEVFKEDGTIKGEKVSLNQETISFRFTTLSHSFSKAALFEIGPDKKEHLIGIIELK